MRCSFTVDRQNSKDAGRHCQKEWRKVAWKVGKKKNPREIPQRHYSEQCRRSQPDMIIFGAYLFSFYKALIEQKQQTAKQQNSHSGVSVPIKISTEQTADTVSLLHDAGIFQSALRKGPVEQPVFPRHIGWVCHGNSQNSDHRILPLSPADTTHADQEQKRQRGYAIQSSDNPQGQYCGQSVACLPEHFPSK